MILAMWDAHVKGISHSWYCALPNVKLLQPQDGITKLVAGWTLTLEPGGNVFFAKKCRTQSLTCIRTNDLLPVKEGKSVSHMANIEVKESTSTHMAIKITASYQVVTYTTLLTLAQFISNTQYCKHKSILCTAKWSMWPNMQFWQIQQNDTHIDKDTSIPIYLWQEGEGGGDVTVTTAMEPGGVS